MREHNRLADKYAAANPTWNDEQIFQAARRMVIAEIQSITYNEFLPALLGPGALTNYRGYNPKVNPGIANEFSTAAFRLGHSMLGDDVEFLDNNGEDLHDEVELRDAFFNPGLLGETGIDPILKYLASDPRKRSTPRSSTTCATSCSALRAPAVSIWPRSTSSAAATTDWPTTTPPAWPMA